MSNVRVTYLGPAHFIEHEGKQYEPGALLTMTEEQARNLQARGHALGGLDPLPRAEAVEAVGNLKQQQATDAYMRDQHDRAEVSAASVHGVSDQGLREAAAESKEAQRAAKADQPKV